MVNANVAKDTRLTITLTNWLCIYLKFHHIINIH